MTSAKASGRKLHDQEPVAHKEKQDIIINVEDSSYDEADDPDFTMSGEVDESEGESDLTEEEEEDTKKPNGSSLDILKDTHHKFKKFVHEQEVPRKLLHTVIGFATLYLYTQGCSTEQIVKPLATAGAIILLLDLIRFRSPAFNKAYCSAVGFMMREQEAHSVNGVIWYILGVLVALTCCPKDVAVMSILLLSWCDTSASTFGRTFGKYTPKIARGKSLAGSLAAFAMGVIACYYFYGYLAPQYPQYNDEFLWKPETSYLSISELAVLCGFIAALSEGIDIYDLDDNLTIPVLSGLFLTVAIRLAQRPDDAKTASEAVATATAAAAASAAATAASTASAVSSVVSAP